VTTPSPCTVCVSDEPCPCRAFIAWEELTAPAAPRPCLRCVDADWLLLAGESFEVTAARLGVLPSSLDRHLRRHGRTDLVPRITGGVYA
jgi:hypothetical protein